MAQPATSPEGGRFSFVVAKKKEVEPEEMLNGASKGKPGALDTVPGSPEGPLAKGKVFSRAIYHPLGTSLTEVGRAGGRRLGKKGTRCASAFRCCSRR